MMEILRPKSLSDIHKMVDLYAAMDDESFIPAAVYKAEIKMEIAWKQNKFIRMAVDENEDVMGWIWADIIDHVHIKNPVYQQLYFASTQKGIKSARVVKILHNALVDEAERVGIQMCLSQGSHHDEDNIFTKLLERFGWDRRGHTAIWKTSHWSK